MGFVTPLLYVAPSYKYFSLKEAFELIKRIGYVIRDEEIPEKLQPLIFCITGKGRCSQGAFEVLKNLPHKLINPDEMEGLVRDKNNPNHKKFIYITFAESQHMVKHQSNKPFDKKEYYNHPERFEPIFHEKYLPYVSAIFHNM
jgi:alpha-aminoadipic semialdehyde synthase